MAVYNDDYDNEEERRADLAWEYRKGGPNDPNLYAEEEPEEDAEEEEEARLIDAEALKKALDEQMNFEENCRDSVFDIIDNAPSYCALFSNEACINCRYQSVTIKPDGSHVFDFRKKGRWVFGRCLICGAYHQGKYNNFCPNCGADMRQKGKDGTQ